MLLRRTFEFPVHRSAFRAKLPFHALFVNFCFRVEAGRNDGNANVIGHVFVNDRAENNVGVGMGGFLHNRGRFADFMQAERFAAGDVNQHAARAVNRNIIEQRAGDGFIGGFNRALIAAGDGRAH